MRRKISLEILNQAEKMKHEAMMNSKLFSVIRKKKFKTTKKVLQIHMLVSVFSHYLLKLLFLFVLKLICSTRFISLNIDAALPIIVSFKLPNWWRFELTFSPMESPWSNFSQKPWKWTRKITFYRHNLAEFLRGSKFVLGLWRWLHLELLIDAEIFVGSISIRHGAASEVQWMNSLRVPLTWL